MFKFQADVQCRDSHEWGLPHPEVYELPSPGTMLTPVNQIFRKAGPVFGQSTGQDRAAETAWIRSLLESCGQADPDFPRKSWDRLVDDPDETP